MEEYKASGGGSGAGGDTAKKQKKKSSSNVSPSKAMAGAGFKSKEFLSDTGSSGSEDDSKVS